MSTHKCQQYVWGNIKAVSSWFSNCRMSHVSVHTVGNISLITRLKGSEFSIFLMCYSIQTINAYRSLPINNVQCVISVLFSTNKSWRETKSVYDKLSNKSWYKSKALTCLSNYRLARCKRWGINEGINLHSLFNTYSVLPQRFINSSQFNFAMMC